MTDPQAVIDKYYPYGTPLRDIYLTHCSRVADFALDILRRKNLPLNPVEVSAAAMTHDIGIFLTDAPGIHCHGSKPYICHGVLGAELLRREGAPEAWAGVAEHHTGTGITAEAIMERGLPLPAVDMMPRNLLERLICYADKFFSKTRPNEQKTLEQVRASMKKISDSTLARFEDLHKEFGK